jgi:hypothetical protein
MILELSAALLLQELDLPKILGREILGPSDAMEELQDHLERRMPPLPEASTPEEWKATAARIRADVLDKIVFRGEAATWRRMPTRFEWKGDLDGGPGYRIRKLRYEAVPGLWVPGLLYQPDGPSDRVPVHLAVNGHDPKGKAADDEQIRCINLAKRGMIVLHPDWLGFGQLGGTGRDHGSLNQLDLCGTSGLAPFYLTLERGLDVLLSLEHADPERVAVHGLSGGGWQTILISSLDPRVTLSNPVAGYSSFRTMVRHFKDLPDSEQAPSDLGTVADYLHLTALRAPRPTLLTYNAKDDCCYESGYALQPLIDAALPFFRLHGAESNLRLHVNQVPGNHNYGVDNREALYRMVGDHFFPGSSTYSSKEISCTAELKPIAQLDVGLPPDNATLTTLARRLAAGLAKSPEHPRAKLRELLRFKDSDVVAQNAGKESAGPFQVAYRRFKVDRAFSVPAVEILAPSATKTVILFSESGRKSLATAAKKRLESGERVLAVDPFYYGESKIARNPDYFANLLDALGERPLGLQAGQIAAIARWAKKEFSAPVTVAAIGPRSSLGALCAAALAQDAVERVEVEGCLGSLTELFERGLTADKAPELFTFGLLESFDVKQLVALTEKQR